MSVIDPDGIVTLDFDTQHAAVTFTIVGTAWPSPVSRIVIERTVEGKTERIRGGDFPASGGFAAAADNEAPLSAVVGYTITGYSALNALVKTVALSIDTIGAERGVWLKLASDFTATSHTRLKAVSDITSTTQGGIYSILGGRNVGVGAFGGIDPDAFTLTLQSLDGAEIRAVDALLRKGRTVLIQACADNAPFPPGWYFISSARRALFAQADGVDGAIWTLDVTSVSRPSGDTIASSGITFQQDLDQNPTFADRSGTFFDGLMGVG